VSTVRYWSFKEVDFAQRRPLQTLLIIVLAVMIIATHLEIFSFALFSFYVLSGPVRRLMVGRTEATPAEPERKESKGVSHNE
jgi:CDP-diacylglycerol--serine O-phosphatidyltransferase